ncbi:MAG TPA: hypothetical protein VFQ61_07965 [Polyangiaceae bacterium]|nr:hypothetical protein [Polyangiaceae bacterium]
MLRLIEKIRQSLEDFIEQRERMLLVVRCRDDDCPILLKLLDELDEASDADLYLLFAIPFVHPQTFVDGLVEEIAKRHELASAALAEENKPPLPPVPPMLRDARKSPQERLRALILYARSLLPEGARRVVFALAPTQILDHAEYLRLVTAITPQRELEPWMPRVRVVLRDAVVRENEDARRAPHPLVQLSPARSAVLEVDLSTEAIVQDMHASTADDSSPMENRAQALFSLALIDAASARPELAIERLDYLLGYYQSTKNALMQGMVLNALGDTFTRISEPQRAKDWYEAALLPAAECKNPILLSTLARNLGNTEFALGNYSGARAYFTELDRVSTHLVDAESKSAALYWRGMSERRLGQTSQAIQSFELGAKLCRGTDQNKELGLHLDQLREIYAEQGMSGKALVVEEELNRLASAGGPS